MSTSSRSAELHANILALRARIAAVADPSSPPVLVAVSKFKPPSDIAAVYSAGHRDFGENYVQELSDKVSVLPEDIRWHFIGHLQSNKAKTVAGIPNLHAIHTVTSAKLASALDKARAALPSTLPPLQVLLQVNTSGEDSKSGLPPLSTPPSPPSSSSSSALIALARHIISSCPHLRLAGLMTIGALQNSLSTQSETAVNPDFETLRLTRRLLEDVLQGEFPRESWGTENGAGLVLSMGMSADYEAAISAGSGIVRVGSSIFGERPQKAAES